MSRHFSSLAHWSSILFAVATLAFGELGCHDSPSAPAYTPPPAPPLEVVPFNALGPGRVAFERLYTDSATGAGYDAAYLVNGTTRVSKVFMNTAPWGLAISPDGRQVAYDDLTDVTTFWDAYVANIDGSGSHRISAFAGNEGPPTWTPDGSMVVLTGSGDDGFWNVYAQSPTATPSTTPRELASFTPDSVQSCPLIGNESPVSVSASGSLAFSCFEIEVDVVSAAGAVTARYIPPPFGSGRFFNVFEPVWSPEGSRVAFLRTQYDYTALAFVLDSVNVMVMDADGGEVTAIASVPVPGIIDGGIGWPNTLSLCWMPDGNHLVFNVLESTYVSHLWVVKADGSGLTQLTSAPGVYDLSVSCAR